MSNGVEFDIDNEPRVVVQTKTPVMVKLVIKFSGGLIKDTTQANLVLLGFAIFAFTLSYFLVFGNKKIISQQTVPMEPAAFKAVRESATR